MLRNLYVTHEACVSRFGTWTLGQHTSQGVLFVACLPVTFMSIEFGFRRLLPSNFLQVIQIYEVSKIEGNSISSGCTPQMMHACWPDKDSKAGQLDACPD